MKILLFGKNGQIGRELEKTLAVHSELIALGRRDMDLTAPDAIRATIQKLRPDVIVNAAAYTTVDKAESEPDQAMLVHGTWNYGGRGSQS